MKRIKAFGISGLFLLLFCTVNGQISVTKSFSPASPVTIGATGTGGTAAGTVNFTSGVDFPAGYAVTDVQLEIEWSKTIGTCAAPAAGPVDLSEVGFVLEHPAIGPRYVAHSSASALAEGEISATWSGSTQILNDLVTFMDGAPSILPAGVPSIDNDFFRSNGESLSTLKGSDFLGIDPGGTWTLKAINDGSALGNLCVSSFRLTLSACDTTTSPTVNCVPSATVSVNAAGLLDLAFEDLDDGTSDTACGLSALVFSPGGFDCGDVGSTVSITMAATDIFGDTSSCVSSVTIADTIAPTALCMNSTVFLDGAGTASLSASMIDAGSTDNCGIATVSASPALFDCGTLGANSVFLNVTDVNGNLAMCSASVTVFDTIAPEAFCTNASVYLDGGGFAFVSGGLLDAGSSDNCGIASVSASPSTFNCSSVGNNPVVVTVFDLQGNTDTCATNVTVTDTMSPFASCMNATVYLDGSGTATVSAGVIDAGTFDNCELSSLSASPTDFNCSSVGIAMVDLTAEDGSGNISTCSAAVTVFDTVSPAMICMDVTVTLDSTGSASLDAFMIDAGSSDACGFATLSASPTTFDCSDVGMATASLIGTDVNGNSSSCMAMVTVNSFIDTAVTVSGLNLTADMTGVSYQWFTCDSGFVPIPGEVSQTYTAPGDGNYAVELSGSGCVDTSSCINITISGIQPIATFDLVVYPNPSAGRWNVVMDKEYAEVQILLRNPLGQMVRSARYSGQKEFEFTYDGAAGYYWMEVKTGTGLSKVMKLIKR